MRTPTPGAAPGAARDRDAGVALPVVIGSMAIVTLFLVSALGLAVGNASPGRADQDAKAAVAAAQAGIDDYVSRLNATSGGYWSLPATHPSVTGNPAFGVDGTPVPGTGGEAASYRYQVLTTPEETAKNGFIVLESTGTSSAGPGGREVSRTLTARLAPRGFLRFIYFTDVEALDPVLYAVGVQARRDGSWSRDADPTRSGHEIYYFADPYQVLALCSQHYYAGRKNPTYTSSTAKPYYEYDIRDKNFTKKTDAHTIRFYCSEIQWATGDVVDGPLHSNDALQVNGAVKFADPTTESSWPASAGGDPAHLWWGSGTPDASGFLPYYEDPLTMPAGNQSLLKHVEPKTDTSANTDRPGCLYRGATRIRFVDGQMKVWSPNTTAADTPSRCLDVGNRDDEQTRAIPPVIHVAPATGSCDDVGYPRNRELLDVGTTTDYDPCRGTAFVQGEVDGQVTVSAEDDIVVTADLTIQDGGEGTDIVGLVAGNNVWVYHPVKRQSGEIRNLLDYDDAVRTIEASILSLRHSFIVQNWDLGQDLSATDADSLRVFGAIAQKFRGPVGTGGSSGGSGYTKNYVYDERLRVLQPPYFLTPDNAPWETAQVTDG